LFENSAITSSIISISESLSLTRRGIHMDSRSMAQTGSVCRCGLWISQHELVDPYQEAFVTHAELL
ncbi:hypothetical protein, partial [Bradyrhizobium elkanii]